MRKRYAVRLAILAGILGLALTSCVGGSARTRPPKPRPGAVWVEGHYSPSGRWINGHWK
ncbi:MAG TPA: hypothetical protein PLI51_00205 [bacterium]|nr:hypothetical protein [bacterium]HPQ65132.1 hypothetical protein [bacterium]